MDCFKDKDISICLIGKIAPTFGDAVLGIDWTSMRDYYKNTTRVPNEIFDLNLKYLSQAELKVLLVIIRQTLGWLDRSTGLPKTKDWISRSFFQKKSGLSYKSISLGIAGLIHNNLIVTTDKYGYILKTAKQRRGKKKIYYAYAPMYEEPDFITRVKKFIELEKKLPYTKGIPTKNVLSNKSTLVKTQRDIRFRSSPESRLTDYERYQQIQRMKHKPRLW